MKFHQVGLMIGGILLVAAQDAPMPPTESSTFSEAFVEQSNAAKATPADEGSGEPAPIAVEPPPEPAAAPADAAETSPAIPAKGDPVTRDYLVGVWAEQGKSCEAGIDFQADGRMIGPFPRWELTDGELTMVGNRQKMRLTVVDKNTMRSRRSETDPPRTLTRCPKAPPPPQP